MAYDIQLSIEQIPTDSTHGKLIFNVYNAGPDAAVSPFDVDNVFVIHSSSIPIKYEGNPPIQLFLDPRIQEWNESDRTWSIFFPYYGQYAGQTVTTEVEYEIQTQGSYNGEKLQLAWNAGTQAFAGTDSNPANNTAMTTFILDGEVKSVPILDNLSIVIMAFILLAVGIVALGSKRSTLS